MRTISAGTIEQAVTDLCVRANLVLRADVLRALKRALKRESSARARGILQAVIDNARAARLKRLALCQDTGMPVVFIEAGERVCIAGDVRRAVNRGILRGYKRASLRNSIVSSPFVRRRPGYTPGVIHIEPARGERLKLTVLPKGFGCENKSRLKMFNPTVEPEEIKDFVLQCVSDAGADACPPFIVGVGLGGTADYACLLAKKALLKRITPQSGTRGRKSVPAAFSALSASSLLEAVNRLNIGPMGLGGRTTALAVHLETYPTHIAGMPVAVNISCHALRSATVIL
ncbi:MAG: fumarate hydratase [Candidatus Omnitrophica bacterium]|nr:fumarate hydratase [Candidatus Omnitrophota bacterium]